MALALGQAANLLLNLFNRHPLRQTLVMVLFQNNRINYWFYFYLGSDVALSLKQVDNNPVNPSEITEADLLPYKCSSASVWKWFRLAKKSVYDKKKLVYSEYQRAYCAKCLSDGIDPMKGSVVYRGSSSGTTTMSTHIQNKHPNEDPPILLKMKRCAESSESESRGSKAPRLQSSLPVVRQLQSQSQDQLNMVFVVNVVMKMGLPLFMADNEGFREWLAMLNPKFQLKHR